MWLVIEVELLWLIMKCLVVHASVVLHRERPTESLTGKSSQSAENIFRYFHGNISIEFEATAELYTQ